MDKIMKEKYTKLATMMNEKSLLHVPIIAKVLDCFEIMITEEETNFLLAIGDKKLKKEELRQYAKCSDKEYETFIHTIFHKGLLWITEDETADIVELAPIFPGWLEVNLFSKDLTPQKMQLVNKMCELLELEEKVNIGPVRMYWNRHKQKKIEANCPPNMSVVTNTKASSKKIAVAKKLESGTNQILPTGEVYSLLEKYGKQNKIALVDCFCRKISKIKGHDCQFHMPLEACLAVGNFAEQMVNYHVGKYISFEEALKVVEECQKKGGIHTVFHYGTDSSRPEICICNCCWDCCCLFGSYNAGGISNIYVKAHAKAVVVEEDKCNGCNICNHFCPTNATGFDKKTGKLYMNVDSCVGCGQCVSKCKKGVRVMEYGERSVYIKSLSKKEIRVKNYAGLK
ncbi:MAG: 4Fe-4S dicluster domain-containing protein [bacterium]|nr:4Fe-4S dicluster domain-containing protein [bacterium]